MQGGFRGAGSAALPCQGLALPCGVGLSRAVCACPVGMAAPSPLMLLVVSMREQSLITAVGKLLGCCVLLASQPKLSQLSATALSAGCAQRWGRNLQLPLTPLSEVLLSGGAQGGLAAPSCQIHHGPGTGQWALSCSGLQHPLSHQGRVCGSLLPAAQAPHSRSLPLECPWLHCIK